MELMMDDISVELLTRQVTICEGLFNLEREGYTHLTHTSSFLEHISKCKTLWFSTQDSRYSTLLKPSAVATHLNGIQISKKVNLAAPGLSRNAVKSFYAVAFQALVTHWDNCPNVAAECVEN